MTARINTGLVTQVHAHTAGGGKLLAILQVAKRADIDDGRARQAALVALATYFELKNVILVNQDVDVFDTDDILWAMTTHMAGDLDIVTAYDLRVKAGDLRTSRYWSGRWQIS